MKPRSVHKTTFFSIHRINYKLAKRYFSVRINIEINEGIQFARKSYDSHGCTIISIIANPVVPAILSTVNNHFQDDTDTAASVYALPEEPLLGNPAVGDVATAIFAIESRQQVLIINQ